MIVKSNNFVSKEEFYKVCRISKKTAYKLIKSGRIKSIKRNCGSRHCYEIPISEIERLESVRCYLNKLREEEIGKVKEYYSEKLKNYPDVITSEDVQTITGYVKETVRRWIQSGKLVATTDNFIAEIKNLPDTEKAKRIADYICDRVVYKDDNVAGINSVFTETPPVNGLCGTYANAFVYLCHRADIPCISVKDDVHAWNEVYIDGEWYIADISYYDTARNDAILFQEAYVRTDINPQKTNFAKELLVPGSTE